MSTDFVPEGFTPAIRQRQAVKPICVHAVSKAEDCRD
jgi:hypothetical protein